MYPFQTKRRPLFPGQDDEEETPSSPYADLFKGSVKSSDDQPPASPSRGLDQDYLDGDD
jgi:hypothetical protein